MSDARFEDAGDQPLRLKALDSDDLSVLSSLVQDAVFPVAEITWERGARRFAILLNRFRWEDAQAADARKRAYERVQSVLLIEDAMRVQTMGVDATDKDLILSLMAVTFEPGEDGTGCVALTLAGDGVIRIAVEALEVVLKDVTRPYIAPSRKRPDHNA